MEGLAQQVWEVMLDCDKAGKDELKTQINDKRKKQKKKQKKRCRKEKKQSRKSKSKSRRKGRESDSSSSSDTSLESSSSSGSSSSSAESRTKSKPISLWQARGRGDDVEFKYIDSQKGAPHDVSQKEGFHTGTR